MGQKFLRMASLKNLVFCFLCFLLSFLQLSFGQKQCYNHKQRHPAAVTTCFLCFLGAVVASSAPCAGNSARDGSGGISEPEGIAVSNSRVSPEEQQQ